MALLLGLFAALCWAVHDLAARHFAPHMGAARLGLRTELAGFVLLLPLMFSLPAASLKDWLAVLALGIVYGFAIIGLFKAFAMAPVSVVGPFTAGYPSLVVVWGMLHGDVPTAAQFLAIAAILAGAVTVGRSGHHDGGMNRVARGKVPLLMFWIILADCCFAASIVMGQALGPVFGDMRTAALLRIPAALVLLPFALAEKSPRMPLNRTAVLVVLGMGGLDALALTGVNAMGLLPYKELGAMGISAYGAIAVPLAMVWLKEKVSKGEWLGVALIAAGVAGLGVQTG
ncbi:MAG: EamA family transporter [Alphaproteobacteria bacterium]|nr:EamA family transporter [Alphaproteobacteria bacterium]